MSRLMLTLALVVLAVLVMVAPTQACDPLVQTSFLRTSTVGFNQAVFVDAGFRPLGVSVLSTSTVPIVRSAGPTVIQESVISNRRGLFGRRNDTLRSRTIIGP